MGYPDRRIFHSAKKEPVMIALPTSPARSNQG
jgi:hypothetical protein